MKLWLETLNILFFCAGVFLSLPKVRSDISELTVFSSVNVYVGIFFFALSRLVVIYRDRNSRGLTVDTFCVLVLQNIRIEQIIYS